LSKSIKPLTPEMKKIIFLTVLLTTLVFVTEAQQAVQKRYFRAKDATRQVSEKAAKYIEEIITEPDGTMKYEMREIKSNLVVRIRRYRDGTPVGEWLTTKGEKLDYNFDLQYGLGNCEGQVYFDLLEKMIYTPAVGLYKPPVFPYEEDNFRRYVVRRIKFPAASYEKGVQGKTMFKFIIDESGSIINLTVLESADKVLDKEAARIILDAPKWKPATIDGKPMKVCTLMGVLFSFQSF
jgi:TonB family protein